MIFSLVFLMIAALTAQPPSQVTGEVTATGNGQVSMKTDKGDAIVVVTSGTTSFRKVPPGATSLAGATRIELSAISVGDRIVAIGQRSEDQKKIEARAIVVMSRSELNEKRKSEQDEWQKRGIAGTATSVDIASKMLTLKSGPRTISVQISDKTGFRRYSPDSVQFSDAQPSSLAELKPGDQVRVLGDRSADGSTIVAEQIVSGAFRQIAATITSLSTQELVVKDLATKKTLTVRMNSNSAMHKLPAEVATSLASRYKGGVRTGNDEAGPLLDRLPSLQISDLKPGDAIMLSTTAGSDPAKVTAIMLLAGVEPLLAASPTATRDILGDWNLGALSQ